MTEFCRHLTNGLDYNNVAGEFTMSPCCYFAKQDVIDSQKTNIAELRQSWQNSDLEKNCAICLHTESSGRGSYRTASFEMMKGQSNKLQHLNVQINKQCNLACASCSSIHSSFWFQENQRNNIEQPLHIKNIHTKPKYEAIKDEFLSWLEKEDLSELKYIKFSGGEPLMSDLHLKVLALVDNPQQVSLQYTSNFSIMPTDTTFKVWEQFKLVKWIASIDGVGERFTFLRWPYDWKTLDPFAKQAKEKAPNNVMFGVEHTLNPLNIYYFDEFEQWYNQNLSTNRLGDKSDLNLHLCWGNLDIKYTPVKLRQKIVEKYNSDHTICSLVKDIPEPVEIQGLLDYLDNLDQWRNQNWREIFHDVQHHFA
tara:strand:- start:1886 stop:2980 length:1095 start_codon:yes stop_codon:yes gene_type:complete